jgi:two-component system, OmpR family, sensor histidine kinase VicK
MSSAKLEWSKLQQAQQRVEILAHNADAFLLEPDLLSTVMEELAVVLEEVHQQYEELLTTRQALEEQRQRYQELFDFAPDGYLVTNAEGIIQEANQAASRLFQVRQAFLVGKPLVVFVAKPDRRAFHTYLSRLQTAAQQRNWDLHLKPRRGDAFPAVITTSAIRSSQNTLLGWRWLVRDITELRQSTLIVRESSAEKKLDELRSNLIQTVSHELRTPMSTILMSMELLKRHAAANESTRETYFDRVQQAVWRMNRLLSDVLLYDELDSDQRSFNPAPLNLEAFCQSLISKLQSAEGERHLLTAHCQGTCDAVSLDEALVHQMLDRLLSNALQYSPNAAAVHVTSQCNNDYTRISVHNEGTFIPPEQQAQLFEPFYCLPMSEHMTGVGLGLAIVKKAVALHGGAIAVESSAQTGTTFSITLPRLELCQSISN